MSKRGEIMLERMQGESIKNYKLRICRDKESLKLSWQDITDLINKETGDSFGESKYRKWVANYLEGHKDGYTEGYDEGLKHNTQSSNVENDSEISSKKERVKLQDQRRELNKLIRDEARFDHVKEEVIKAINKLADEKPLFADQPKSSSTPMFFGQNESALLLSDWHKGLFARNYWNSFDDNEFNRRVKRLVNKTLEYNRSHNVQKMHIFTLGDLVNGLIHVTTRISNTEDVVAQTMSVSETLSEIFVEFARHTEAIKIYFCRGNHDRITANKSDEIEKESFADIILWFLKARISHISNIEFVDNKFDDEIIHANICGHDVLAVHGHKDKPSSVIQDLTLMTKVVPSYVFMGHYHHHEENEVQGVELIVNSSLSGVDSYAKDIRRTSKPAQKLIIFSPEESRLCTYSIRLDR
jgi:hypothetical protein